MATIRLSTIAKVLLAVMVIPSCGSFVLDDSDALSSLCFPQDQFCSCSYTPENTEKKYTDWLEVTCSAKNLTIYPNFTKISDQVVKHYKNWGIVLSDNELTTIPSGVFSNFNSANTNETYIYLSLERNKISLIENGAFIGINHMDLEINLTDNRIAALPLAFQLLTHLESVSLQGNPILAFDTAILNSMAKSLNFLEIDYPLLLLGNKELSVLNLTYLTINDISSDYGKLTFNPFLIFSTVPVIYIALAQSTTLPCTLIEGREFCSIEYSPNISANSVFDCQPGTNLKVFNLAIIVSDLEEFPDILKFTPSLRALNLIHNKISSVNEKFIPLHNKLEVLSLSYNQLRTIPAVFSRFENLKMLYIEYNQITFVVPESNVLSVPSVCASGNPWTHDGLKCDYSYASSYYWYIDNTTIITPHPSSY